MPYFAQVTPTGTSGIYNVKNVIRITQEEIDTGNWGDPATWFQGDYNTYGNVHYAPSPPAEPYTPDGGTPIRANYPGIGYTFNTNYTIGDYLGVFYAPQPYPSWILNTSTFLWEAPVPYPSSGGPYVWDEATLSWVAV
jgi:hypothetical protein